jgi:hypothetical protein
MNEQEKKNQIEKFIFSVPSGDGDFLDIALQNNLSIYSTHVGYISALASSGKITSEEAYSQVKKLHKNLKESQKTLKGSWF